MVEQIETENETTKTKRRFWPALLVLAFLCVLLYTQITIFVIRPIGALPEGKTLIMLRMGAMDFIDSADAICARKMGGVSLLSRGVVLGKVGENATILARLPYSEGLYLLSTGGKTYDR